MPYFDTSGAGLYYDSSGSGSEVMVFAHGLFFDHRMWERQVAQFGARYRCIAVDFRGHGRTRVHSGGYDMDLLARDLIALIEHLQLGAVHWVGLSLGGYVGMRIAARRRDCIQSLVLISAAAEPESMLNYPRYLGIVAAALTLGLRVLQPVVFPVLFSEGFLRDASRKGLRREISTWFSQNRRWGISRASYAVLSRLSIADELMQIQAPTLVLSGDADQATPPARAVGLAQKIKKAELVMVPGAGHMLNLEQPERVNAEIERFLAELRIRQAADKAQKVRLGLAEPESPAEVLQASTEASPALQAAIETDPSLPDTDAHDATAASPSEASTTAEPA